MGIQVNDIITWLHNPDNSVPDDDTIATRLQQEVRLLCWVMTSPENLYSKAIHVKDTWGKRCDHLLFASDSYDPSFPTINITVQSGTEHLVDKTIAAFDYIYKYYLHKADWFLKADDDTYIVVENLRYLLSRHDPQEPVFFGNHFMTGSRIGFMSGGAGYVTSKKALQRFGERSGRTCHDKDAYAEDILWAQCMEQLGVHPGDSRDVLNRSRFHCQDVNSIIHGSYPDWIPKYQKYGAHKGAENMSEFAVSFHYIKPEMMHTMDYLIYKLKPYGIVSGLKKT